MQRAQRGDHPGLRQRAHERVEEVLDTWGLPEVTPYSITDREVLYEQLAEIRERGYSSANQEVIEGFDDIGVVIKRPDGSIIGAVTVGWPTYHFESDIPQRIIHELLDTKEAIEAEIEVTGS